MRLNLGVGRDALDAWVNVDMQHYEGVDMLWDLDKTPWPFEDQNAEEIQALDIFEHLLDLTSAMDECWRVLKPGGGLTLRVPVAGGPNHYADPTHRRGFTKDSMGYYCANVQEYEDMPLIYGAGRWELCRQVERGANWLFLLRRLP